MNQNFSELNMKAHSKINNKELDILEHSWSQFFKLNYISVTSFVHYH